ncbi:hypothetical protein HPP92_021247 [Vanilla planifolia]|uniref:Uncharacterized protein n=1 Tax=Vanilla planifolia TaxID=51239 RepID=A0A835PYG9_VANPL|nr:hypothetical protein HPP92_021247 [Vanilla planifolia]
MGPANEEGGPISHSKRRTYLIHEQFNMVTLQRDLSRVQQDKDKPKRSSGCDRKAFFSGTAR